MRRAGRTVLVAGAGIAGLTAALAIAQAGFRVDLFEQAEGFETIGAGLQISPNAFKILARLGIAGRLKEAATGPLAIRVMSARNGREIAAIPLGGTAISRYGAPYLVAHRADLQQILVREVHRHPAINLQIGARVEDFSSHRNGVTALVLHNGKLNEVSGCAMVAADGVWSILRKRCFGAQPAVQSGYTAWRALVSVEQLTGAYDLENVQLWLAPNAHGVSYPVRAGRHLNVVIITRDRRGAPEIPDKWVVSAFASELKPALRGWSSDVASLLQLRTRWTRWPLYRSPRTARLAKGPAAMIGDAAHAMLPFAAQGAAMGIEDAAVLADCLGRHGGDGDVSEAMEEYQQRRSRRLARAIRLSDSNCRIFHLSRPLAAIRDTAMAMSGGERLLARQDWIYGWQEPMTGISASSQAHRPNEA
jgi:2-polyprenyl-6-methoxyphenol hydroxylase-like FAD-dependent oxidoreductase